MKSLEPRAARRLAVSLCLLFLPLLFTPLAAPSFAADDAGAAASAQRGGQAPALRVEIYTTPSCSYCKMLRKYLDAHGVEYIEHNIAASEETRAAFYASGARGVPVTVIGDQRIQGFNPWRIGAALRLARAQQAAPE